MKVEERRKIGLKYLKAVDGEDGDKVIKNLDGLAEDIGNYILEFAFGEIYNRKFLSLKQREMITITSLLSQGGAQPQLKVHIKGAFKESGVVTAGNSSSINDGASILMLVSEKVLDNYNLTPLAEWIDSSLVGLEPQLMGMGPEFAVKKLLVQQKMDIADIDIFELNEAFAAQSIACLRQLRIDDINKVNPKGGAIALGHPVGASGSRILTTLIYELIENKASYGVASLCVGGGMGVATLIKRITNP